jgi:replicative DNA helicase
MTDHPTQAVPGGAAILDEPEGVPAVWGHDTEVAWSEGEPLLIVGPPGVGKTTLAQQVALRRIGIGGPSLLGLPVARDERPVLYVAADRPRQAVRSMRRMVTEADRRALDAGLIVWRGPLPFHLPSEPERLAAMADHYKVGTVVVDSLNYVPAATLENPRGTSAGVNTALESTS